MTFTKLITRRPTANIVADNAERIAYTASQRPRFPDVREVFGNIAMMASFSHPAPDPIARELFGNKVLFETAIRAGLIERPATAGTSSITSDMVTNLAYDFGVPAHRDNWHAPGYNRIAMGDFPEVISPSLPYFVQKLRKKIDGKTLAAVTSKDFKNSAAATERAWEAVMPFTPFAFEGKKGTIDALPVLLQVRESVFNLMRIDHIKESSAFALSGRIAQALQILDEKHGLRFYEMPLTNQFRSGGYLCALDSNSMRRPVDVRTDGGRPTFVWRDPVTKEVTEILGEGIYESIRDGTIIPTVPTFLLATLVGPQIPQMGGRDWKQYAPELISTIAGWAGIENRSIPALYLCTEGYDPFRVYYKGSASASKHFTMSYVTFGKEEMVDALRTDTMLIGRYGVTGAAIKKLARK